LILKEPAARRDVESEKKEEKKEEEKEELIEVKAHNTQPPKVTVYKHSDTVILESDLRKLYALFTLKDVPKEEIRIIDVTNNLDAQAALADICEHLVYPVICISGHPVGNFEQLMKLSKQDGKIEDLLEGKVPEEVASGSGHSNDALLKSVIVNATPTDHAIGCLTQEEQEEQLRLGVVGGMLGMTESVLTGVSALVKLPITIITWPFRSQPAEEKMGEGDEDFLVIQSNWYARSQWRTYRFKNSEFLRLHPNGEVRARHPYSGLKSIEFVDRRNIILNYTDDGSPDYVQATAENIQKMVKRWTDQNKEVEIKGNIGK
jgi:hypothetical protein